jgi:hypothetical protein
MRNPGGRFVRTWEIKTVIGPSLACDVPDDAPCATDQTPARRAGSMLAERRCAQTSLAAECPDQDQRLHGCLPLRGLVLGLGELCDVVAGILQRDELPTAGQRDRIVKRSFPAAISHSRASLAAFARADRSSDISQPSTPRDRAIPGSRLRSAWADSLAMLLRMPHGQHRNSLRCHADRRNDRLHTCLTTVSNRSGSAALQHHFL